MSGERRDESGADGGRAGDGGGRAGDGMAEPAGEPGTDAGDALTIAVEGPLTGLTDEQRTLLLERRPADEPEVRSRVRDLLDDVRSRGDEALFEMAERFDGLTPETLEALDTLEVPAERLDEALREMEPDVRRALERAARNIEAFHTAQIPADVRMETEDGVRLGRRFVPLDVVGVYAPGGRASYPSSVLMGVVPARAAGVKQIVVCSPPGPSGEPPAEVLAAAALGGATRVFALGGAGAVGAMAYGTASVPPCAAIVGPGNRWVLEAKRQVAGDVVIDSPAGPSEVLVVADARAPADRVAAELVAQAEHDPDAAVALVTWSEELLAAARDELARQVAGTPRRRVVEEALAGLGALLLAGSRREALSFARDYAAEHLVLYTDDPEADLAHIPTAGTAFLGPDSSVAHGDYLTGANHVLPTAGTSRSYSGLSTLHFLRSYTWQEVSAGAAARMADDVERLATAEGLPAHGRAARMRAEDKDRRGGTDDGAQNGAQNGART